MPPRVIGAFSLTPVAGRAKTPAQLMSHNGVSVPVGFPGGIATVARYQVGLESVSGCWVFLASLKRCSSRRFRS